MNYIQLFIDHLKIDKGSSSHTCLAYERDLKQFENFLQSKSQLQQANESHIEAFLKELKTREQKGTSIARKISALKQFYRFLIQENILETDPTLFIHSPVHSKKLPKALDNAAVLALLHAADTGLGYDNKFAEALKLRDRAMIYLLYATGVRVSELITITTSQLDIEAGYVKVMGKRRKERLIPFAPIAGEHLSSYLQTGRPNLAPECDTLFIGQRGEALTRQAFWGTLKKIALLAGIPQNLHPHMLRHTFATDLLQAGMNLRSLQLLLGHADLQTTQIYTHIAPEQLKEVIRKFHPRGGG